MNLQEIIYKNYESIKYNFYKCGQKANYQLPPVNLPMLKLFEGTLPTPTVSVIWEISINVHGIIQVVIIQYFIFIYR